MEASPAPPGLERLTLRIDRLRLTFRFTYAFHAREVRFECDRGDGFVRLFPETFSFHADRHDPAELMLQLSDLAAKPQLLAPEARRRDAELLVSRLLLGLPRYLERMAERLRVGARLEPDAMVRVHQDIAFIVQIFSRFAGSAEDQERQGLRQAIFHLRKILYISLKRVLDGRVARDYIEAYMDGTADPVDRADDLSETGFFYTLENGDASAVNRAVVRLAERAFYRWLEDICLDESNDAFDGDESPFAGREAEVRLAVAESSGSVMERARDLVPFLRRPGNRDTLRVLKRLEAWFLRQYDIHHAAVMIQHARDMSLHRCNGDRVLSRHRTRNYIAAILALTGPLFVATVAYERAPKVFDWIFSVELLIVQLAVMWFLLYRFLWKRDLLFFHSAVPRIIAGIIVGYLPIFFIDEVWSLATLSWHVLGSIVVVLGTTTLLYLYIEVQRRLGDTQEAFSRARQIFLLGLLQASGIGLVFTGMVGHFMALRNWAPDPAMKTMAAVREGLPPFVGQLPPVVGVEPLLLFPSAVFVMTFMSFFIGTFLQLMWEDLPITEPL